MCVTWMYVLCTHTYTCGMSWDVTFFKNYNHFIFLRWTFFTFFSCRASVFVVFYILFYTLLCVFLLPNVAFDTLCCSIASCGNLCRLSIHARLFQVFHRRNKEENRVRWMWFLSYLYCHSQLRPCLRPPPWTIPFLHKHDDVLLGVTPNCLVDRLNCSTMHCDICNGWVCGWVCWTHRNWHNEEWWCVWW